MSCTRMSAFLMLGATFLAGTAKLHAKNEEPQVQKLKSLSLEDLGNVRVTTVTKEPEEVWQTPAAVYVLTQNDIRRSGATTLPDLLRTVPGVEVAEMQSDQWAVGIRGFGSQFSRGVLLLIDGRSAYTDLFEGVNWDVQDVPLADIERIEIIRGPGGTIWGANAVNGVINIITKDSRDTQGTLVRGLSGRMNRFDGLVREGLHHNDFYYRIFVHGFEREDEVNPGFDPYDRWHLVHGGVRADWGASARDRFSVTGSLYAGQAGQQVPIVRLNPLEQFTTDMSYDVSGGDVNFYWEHHSSGTSDLRLRAYFDRSNRHGISHGETRNTFDVDLVDRFVALKRNDIIFGAGVRLVPSHFIMTQDRVDFSPRDQTDYIYSAFAQDTVQLSPKRLNLVLGTKLEYNNFSHFEYQPTARILWNPTVHSSLWAAVSRAVRTPGRVDQGAVVTQVIRANPLTLERAEGSPSFKSEELLGYEAGYRQLLTRSLYADVAAFYNRYARLEGYGAIQVTTITNPVMAQVLNVPLVNGNDGVTNGFEIAPDWKVRPWWELKGNYSYLHIHTQPRPGFTNLLNATVATNNNGSSPHREATAQSYLDLPHGFDFNLDYRFVSRLPAQSVKSYQTADAHLGWRVTRNWRLSVTGRNLLQPSHHEFAGDDGNAVRIRRAVYAGLTWTR